MILPFQNKIWFYQQPVNFNKQINGLSMLVADQLDENPTSGQLFIFRNKRADKIRLLYWEGDGFWLFYKRLSKSKFKFPQVKDDKLELSHDQLCWLLSGLDITDCPKREKQTYTYFF
ncbi:IS66 family insertion sequence element accessory protein TnpB [Piscirickettsia salmonis]|uniref:IS66 family insertion sequence element accessory protein TnpB n=1 Tax=Piscirickettsia salmonis TaxID=1238 RepID=UPI003EBFB50B